MKKLCCVFSTPSLYRRAIYKMIDNTFDCDWFFEERENTVKQFDSIILNSFHFLSIYDIGALYWEKGVLRIFFSSKYDKYLMMGHSRNLSTLLVVILKRLFFPKKQIFLWTHGFYGKEGYFETLWKKVLLKSADGLLIYGDYACGIMKNRYGFNSKKLYPIHNSLDYDAQLMIRNGIKPSSIYKDHFHNENKTLLFIGRLTFVKKLNMLICAVADLKAQGECYNLVFVGDGEARTGLEKMAIERSVSEQVWFYGACYDDEKNAELVYNADLCVAPGNIGLTAMHVMMFGCPAISHDDFAHQMPEFEAIKEGKTGTLFQRDSQKSLNESISQWFSQEGYNRENIRKECYNEIDKNWNPNYQMKIIKEILK